MKKIETQVSKEHSADTILKIQELITALPDSPDNAGIIAELQGIINSVDTIELSSVTLISLLNEIQVEIDGGASGTYLTALENVQDAFVDLENGFDIDELYDAIETLINNIPTIAANNGTLSDNLDLFKIELETIMTNAKLNKSKNGILFPKRVYYNEIITAIFNTKGYKNLIITMAGSSILNSLIFSDFSQSQNIIDSNIDSKTSDYFLGSIPPTAIPETRIDFGTKALRNLSAKFESHANSNRNASLFGITRVKVFISDDDIAYIEIFTQDFQYYGNNINIRTIDTGEQDYRYAKVTLENYDNGHADHRFSNDVAMYEIFDNEQVGGTVALSIEIKDAFDEWFVYVTAGEIGAITKGIKTIKIFGEAVGNKALPSTQDSLRFVLTVTGGGIKTGVSVMRVA